MMRGKLAAALLIGEVQRGHFSLWEKNNGIGRVGAQDLDNWSLNECDSFAIYESKK